MAYDGQVPVGVSGSRSAAVFVKGQLYANIRSKTGDVNRHELCTSNQ